MALLLIQEKYYEIIDSESPAKSTFGKKISSSNITFLVQAEDILKFIQDVLGSSVLKNNSYVSRVIPASHPIFPWQYASSIADIKGYTPSGKQESSILKADTNFKNVQTEVPLYAGFYKQYKINVVFESRNYMIYTDEDLAKHKSTNDLWMPITLKDSVLGERFEQYDDRLEYLRYCNYEYHPVADLLTYGNGNFFLKGSENTEKIEFPLPDNSNNNLLIAKIKLDWQWFFVPFELSVNNKIWTDAYSKINLNTLFDFFYKGTLLLSEIKVTKYEPYYPFSNIYLTNSSSVYDYFTEYNKNQYCDITFSFSLFDFPLGISVHPDAGSYQPFQCKDPNSPHNKLLNPGNMAWYYFESSVDQTKGRPLYFSYPMENIFNYVQGP